MPPGQESLVIIVDYKSTTLRTNPSISVARKVRKVADASRLVLIAALGSPYIATALCRNTRPSTRGQPSHASKFLLQRYIAFPRSSN